MAIVAWLNELSRTDIPTAGGKGANLAEMFNAGFPVPEAFVVTSQTYSEFVRGAGIDKVIRANTERLDVQDSRALTAASEAMKKAISGAHMPENIRTEIVKAYNRLCKPSGVIPLPNEEVFVAVRSSATAEDLPQASFAGQQATFLNERGADNVVKAVQDCWASLFEARAIFYRTERGFDHLKVGLAAVVQRMVQSDVSGVMFTVDPVTNDESKIDIEAAYGLGEAVVSGALSPDRYMVDKATLEVGKKVTAVQTWKFVRAELGNKKVDVAASEGSKQKLTDDQIMKLAKIGRDIETHYGGAIQDVEWAVEGGRLYIVQTRPVTTLKKKAEVKPAVAAEALVRGVGASPGIGTGPVKLVKDFTEIWKVQKGDILVTEMTSPDFVPAMEKAAAIVTDSGGATCHAAIVSREMGIPCIVGTGNATKVLKEGEIITVDAKAGVVYKGEMAKAPEAAAPAAPVMGAHIEIPVTATKVYVNLGEPTLAEKIAARPVDGVGLFRAEFMLAGFGVHPKQVIAEGKQQQFIDRIAEGMRQMAQPFFPRPVVYRATDFKSNEYKNLKGGDRYEKPESNPMIGYRGCFRYVKEPEVFMMELAAIKKVREQFGLKNLWLMIPFVRTVEELREVKKLIEKSGLHLDRDFKIWIMVEVPSAVIMIDEMLLEGVDGVSIGSNDLTQLTLGVDRDNERMAEEFDERDEAVMGSLRRVVDACRRHGKTVSICGQAPSVYPEITEALVRWGTTSVSINPDMIEKTRELIAAMERKLLLERARSGR